MPRYMYITPPPSSQTSASEQLQRYKELGEHGWNHAAVMMEAERQHGVGGRLMVEVTSLPGLPSVVLLEGAVDTREQRRVEK